LPSQLITSKAFLYSNELQQWRLLAKKGGLERGRLTAMGWLKMDSPAAQSTAEKHRH